MIHDIGTATPATIEAPPSGRAKPGASKKAKPKAAKAKAKPAEAKSRGAAPAGKGPPPALAPGVLGAGVAHVISDEDREFLEAREAIIGEGFKGFLVVGRALLEIREYGGGRLWRAQYGSFESYCKIRWGFDRQYGYRLMDAARVIEELKLSPRGDSLPEPTCEAQVRPVAMLADPADRVRAWQMTVDQHGPDPIGREVGAVVRRMLKDGAEPRSKRPSKAKKKEPKPAKAPRPDDAIASDAPHGHARGEGDGSAEPAEVGGDPPQECGPATEAQYLRQLDALEATMVQLRDPDTVLSPECIRKSKAFHRSLGRFIEAAEQTAREREQDARQAKLPLDDEGTDKGATP